MAELGVINGKTRIYLKENNPIAPVIYGYPKLHKQNRPQSPIVSTYFAKIIKKILEKTDKIVKNCWELVNFLKHRKIKSGYILISLDVNSLFTNVPGHS